MATSRDVSDALLVAIDFFALFVALLRFHRQRRDGAGFQPLQRDRLDVIGRAIINGVEVGQGTGADVLGHPHHALAWLANHLASDGHALRAGEIVLTGSLVKTIWLNAGDSVVMELSGLGSVAATFA